MKIKKRINFFKLETKKYGFKDIGNLFLRSIIDFAIIVLAGVSIGCLLFLLVKNNNYSSNCKIHYSGQKLDTDQQSRIVSLITCNESIDKYVESLTNKGITYDGSYFTFSDFSNNLSSSIVGEAVVSPMVDFSISLTLKKPSYTVKALKVIAETAVRELESIYTKDSFVVIYDSFSPESYHQTKNKNCLIIPIAVSVLLGFIYIFIDDGLSNTLFDYSDCGIYFKNIVKIKKKKRGDHDNLVELIKKEKPTLIADKADIELINCYLEIELNKSSKEHMQEADTTSLSSYKKLICFDGEAKIPNDKKCYYIAIMGKSKYSDFVNNAKALNKIRTDISIICIDLNLVAKKNDKK